MSISGAQQQLTQAILSWPGATVAPHRFGGVEYQLGQREIGHIHGDSLVDIPFPIKVRDEIVGAGQAQPHHILPNSGWVSIYLQQQEDVERAVDLLRRSYEIAARQRRPRNIDGGVPAPDAP